MVLLLLYEMLLLRLVAAVSKLLLAEYSLEGEHEDRGSRKLRAVVMSRGMS